MMSVYLQKEQPYSKGPKNTKQKKVKTAEVLELEASMDHHCKKLKDEYEFIKLIGKGSYATIFKARCLKTGEVKAIKYMEGPLFQSEGNTMRVLREI